MALGGKIAAFVRTVVAPISNVGGRLGADITKNGYFATRQSLEAQISSLQQQVQAQQLQAAAFASLQQQNTSLASLEHLAETTPGLAAPITSSVISSPYGTFTIGAGTADTVQLGAQVLTAEGFVIGKVVQVGPKMAVVQEIFAPAMETAVTIDGTASVAAGQGGQAVAQIPHGATVAVGDPVIAPQYNDRPIGIVQHVDTNPANAQQAVYIALPVSLSSITYAYITP